MSEDAWPDPTWVLDALDRLRLRYEQRTSARGTPYAGLVLRGPGGGSSSLTVLAEDGTLRVTAHDVLVPVERSWRAAGRRSPAAGGSPGTAAATRTLPLARAYRTSEGTVEVALGCFVGAAPLAPEELDRLLQHTTASARCVRDGGPPPGLPPFPAPAASGSLPDVDAPWCRVGLVVEPGGWVTATASGVPALTTTDHPDGATVLDRLQLWTRAGRYVARPDGTVDVEVRTPVRDDDLGGRVEWTRAQATLMVDVARRHLAAPVG